MSISWRFVALICTAVTAIGICHDARAAAAPTTQPADLHGTLQQKMRITARIWQTDTTVGEPVILDVWVENYGDDPVLFDTYGPLESEYEDSVKPARFPD